MASVHRRVTPAGSVIYRAVWKELGPGGKRVQRSRNFTKAGDAKAHAARMEQEVEKRGVGDPQKHTLEVFLKRWLAMLADRGEHSPTTLAAYRWQADIACRHIGHIPLEKLSPADLDQLYSMLLRRGGVARKANADGSNDTRPLTAAHGAAHSCRFTRRVRAGAQMETDRRESGQGCERPVAAKGAGEELRRRASGKAARRRQA